MTKQKLLFVGAIIGLTLLLGALRSSFSSGGRGAASSNIPDSVTTGTVKSFSITARRFTFEPQTITVQKGDTVRLTLISKDVAHSFALRTFNINVDLPAGQTKSVEFVADQVGAFTFRCWVYCGNGHSDMAGQLVVQ